MFERKTKHLSFKRDLGCWRWRIYTHSHQRKAPCSNVGCLDLMDVEYALPTNYTDLVMNS